MGIEARGYSVPTFLYHSQTWLVENRKYFVGYMKKKNIMRSFL